MSTFHNQWALEALKRQREAVQMIAAGKNKGVGKLVLK